LKGRGFTISNFFNTKEPSFRIGCIGDVSPQDMQCFVGNVDEVLIEMGVKIRRGN